MQNKFDTIKVGHFSYSVPISKLGTDVLESVGDTTYYRIRERIDKYIRIEVISICSYVWCWVDYNDK